MAFKVRKLNHTPAWYRGHCNGEDGGSAAFRAMLKNDMAFIGADNDPNLCYEEKVGPYEERWNAIMGGAENLREPGGRIFRSDILQNEMVRVEEDELLKDYKPFEDEPFTSIDKLMTEAGLDGKVIREFLRRRTRRGQAVETEVPTADELAHAFKSFDDLMSESGLDKKTVHKFLRWRNRRHKAVETEVPTVVEPASENQNPFFG